MTSLAIALTVLLLLAIVQLYTLYQKIIIERKEKANLLLKLSIIQEENQLVKETTELYYKELYKSWRINTEKEIRKDANKRSRSILRGQATEQIAPFLMEELNPKDYRFLGNPIDYIVFSGLSDITDGESDTIDKIIFLDIKTGKSNLSKVQRRIRDCISEGRIEFLIYNPDKVQQKKEELEIAENNSKQIPME